MDKVIRGRRAAWSADLAVRLEQDIDPDIDGYADMSDLELLATAVHEALTARHEGLLGGPGVDEAALARAARRARRRDASALLRAQVSPLRQMVRAAA
jgi:hypothetical protein